MTKTRNNKRLLSLLMALVMVLGLFPVSAKAAAPLAEGSYMVPITSLTSGAPIPAVAAEFAKSFGTEVQVDVDAAGKMTATIVPQHLLVNVGGNYHCNILKIRSAAGEATYPEMKTELVTPTFGKPDVTQDIECPAKAVLVLPAANAQGAYDLEVTADFMNALKGDINTDHWMSVVLTLDFAHAEAQKPAGPSFEFGTQKTVIDPGTYVIPTALKHADHHERPSMAAAAILGGVLEVQENGDAYVNVKLGPVDAYGMHGWSTNWKIYDVYQCESQLPDDPKTLPLTEAEIVNTAVEDGQTYPSEIRFKLPFTDKDGVYATMFVPIMGAYPNGFLSLDFANVMTQEEADKAAAKAVEDQIAALGEVTLESEAAITEARAAYDGLTEAQKALVTNLSVLEAAEAKLQELKDAAAQAEADKAAAKVVEDQIAALGEVTLESEAAITEARAAYDALTEAQKALVTNLSVLEAAEAKLQELKDAAAQAEADKAAAKAVEDQIAALGEVTLESEAAITEARAAYDALTEAQKALVTNLSVLEAAEAKLQELKDAAAQAEADKAAAKAVEDQIAAIGEVTLKSEAAITKARDAYDGLTEAQKALVKNLDVLEAAEAKLAQLYKEHNTHKLAEGSYNVPIIALTSNAPLEPVAIAFSKAFGDTVRIDVAADGTMTATILPQHMVIDLFGNEFHCNVLKLRSTKGEAQYADITTQKYTDATDSQLYDIQAPGKMVVGMPAYDETKNGYPLELTVDFMNTMYSGVDVDNWMDVVLSLDLANAEAIAPEAAKSVRVTYYTTGAGTVARKTVEVAEDAVVLTAEDCAETLPEGYRFVKSGEIRDSRRGSTVRVMIEKIPAKETRTVIVNYVSETGKLIGIKKVVVDSASIVLTAEDCAATLPAGYEFVKSGVINAYLFCNTAVVTVRK